MLGTYLFFGSDDDLRLFGGLLLSATTAEERIRTHNFFVASTKGDDFFTENGKALLAQQFPLFPADPRLNAINLKLLRDAAAVNRGSGDNLPTVFARRALLEGAGTLPIVQQPDGSWVADSTTWTPRYTTGTNSSETQEGRRTPGNRGVAPPQDPLQKN